MSMFDFKPGQGGVFKFSANIFHPLHYQRNNLFLEFCRSENPEYVMAQGCYLDYYADQNTLGLINKDGKSELKNIGKDRYVCKHLIKS